MGFDHHGGDQAFDRRVVGEDPDHIGATLDLSMEAFEGVGRPDLAPVRFGKGREGQQVLLGVGQHGGDIGELALQRRDDPVELLSDRGGVGLGEDRLDGGDHHVGVVPLDPGQHVAHEVHPTALLGRAHHHGLDGLFEPQVLVRDDQADSAQPPGPKGAQELGPKGPVF